MRNVNKVVQFGNVGTIEKKALSGMRLGRVVMNNHIGAQRKREARRSEFRFQKAASFRDIRNAG